MLEVPAAFPRQNTSYNRCRSSFASPELHMCQNHKQLGHAITSAVLEVQAVYQNFPHARSIGTAHDGDDRSTHGDRLLLIHSFSDCLCDQNAVVCVVSTWLHLGLSARPQQWNAIIHTICLRRPKLTPKWNPRI